MENSTDENPGISPERLAVLDAEERVRAAAPRELSKQLLAAYAERDALEAAAAKRGDGNYGWDRFGRDTPDTVHGELGTETDGAGEQTAWFVAEDDQHSAPVEPQDTVHDYDAA